MLAMKNLVFRPAGRRRKLLPALVVILAACSTRAPRLGSIRPGGEGVLQTPAATPVTPATVAPAPEAPATSAAPPPAPATPAPVPPPPPPATSATPPPAPATSAGPVA